VLFQTPWVVHDGGSNQKTHSPWAHQSMVTGPCCTVDVPLNCWFACVCLCLSCHKLCLHHLLLHCQVPAQQRWRRAGRCALATCSSRYCTTRQLASLRRLQLSPTSSSEGDLDPVLKAAAAGLFLNAAQYDRT
jgi:hypothetical protein